jgi:hypothetical protein
MTEWGRWRLSVEEKALVRPPYTVRLAGCQHPRRQIEMLFEMSDAPGIDTEDLGNLVLALRDVFGRGVPEDWEDPVMNLTAAIARADRRRAA